MKQKKIIIFNPSLETGGVEKNLYLILKFLNKSVQNINIITCDKEKLLNKGFSRKIIISPNNFKHNRRIIKYFACLYLLIKEIIVNNGNIQVLSFQANLYAILVCKFFNIKIVVRSNSSSYGWATNYVKIFIFQKILKMASKVIVNSKDLQKEFLRKFKINTVLIYNPLNINEIIKLSKQKNKDIFFYNNKSLNIITIGRFVEQKNHMLLLKALNNLKKKINFKLLLIGQGKYLKIYKNYISKNKITRMVKIIKFQKNPYPFYKNSDLLILTSKYEGFPNVILEALALNKFVISSDCPTGPKELLNNKNFGYLFKNNNLNDLIIKICNYAENKDKINISKFEVKKSLDKFDYKKNMKKYLQLLN